MKRRAKRIALWTGGVLLVPLLLLASLIWWAHSEGSLRRALGLAQRWLPPEQQLVASAVTGALLGGGHVNHLQWSRPGLSVTVEGLVLEWSPGLLLRRELAIGTLSLAQVRVQATSQPDKPDEPFVMPSKLTLPMRVTAPLSIDRLEYRSTDESGTSVQQLQRIVASYRYDGREHSLRLVNLERGQSGARASVQLNAESLAVTAEFDATLKNLVADVPQAMQVRMTARGRLSGSKAAQVDVALDARQAEVAAADAAQLTVRATLHPWRDQPAQQVDLQLNRLNLHAFLARAPLTSLRGQGSLTPLPGGTAWRGLIDIANDLPDAWDRGGLPVRHLKTEADLSLEQLRVAGASLELGGRAAAGAVMLQGRMPLQQVQQATLQLDLQAVDLRQLLTTLPRTLLAGPISISPAASIAPAAQGRRITGDIRNLDPGPLDADRMPVERLVMELQQRDAGWHIGAFDLQVGDGHALLQGNYSPGGGALNLRAELRGLLLRRMHRKLAADAAPRLTGSMAANGSLQREIAFEASLGSSARSGRDAQAGSPWEIRSLDARGRWSASRLRVERIHLDAFQARVDGSDVDIALPALDSVAARLKGEAPGVAVSADARMSPQGGGGHVDLQLASADALANWLRGLPGMDGRLPALRARGAARFAADWQGNWQQWLAGIRQTSSQSRLHLDATAHSEGLDLELPATATRSGTHLNLRKLDLNAQGNLLAATLTISTDVRLNNTRATLDAQLKSTRAPGRRGTARWNVDIDRFAAGATLPGETRPWSLQLSDNLQLSTQFGEDIELTATAGTATVLAPAALAGGEPLKVNWQPLVWRRTSQGAMTLQSSGTISGLQPAWLDALLAHDGEGPLATAGMGTDLMLGGEWNVQLAERVALRARLQRERGDLWQMNAQTRAGIRKLDLAVEARDENVNATLDWDTGHAGTITARVATRLRQQAGGWSLPPQAPLTGEIRATLPELSSFAFLAPPGWRIQGEMKSSVQLSGTVIKPQLAGNIEGDNLNIRSVLDGVDLHNGRLRAALRDSRMAIGTLQFEGGTGSRAHVRGFSGNRTPAPTARGRMTAQGYIDWSGIDDPANTDVEAARSRIAMKLDARLERMQVLVRHDRQMTLSGTLGAALNEGTLQVRGDLAVDRAAIVLPEASAPTLGDDVLIHRDTALRNAGAVEALQARGELETRKPMDMQVRLDLGRDLALEGQGITTRLEGDLTVRSATTGSDPFRVFGEVRTVEGRYRAWGQALDVETGVVRFNGPYGNPSLDLLAIRPKIEVRAGVRVTGTLLAPRVQLFSEPDLPEGEKLSWVVLGRATVINGAEGSSMQQAALGLAAGQLGGRLASGLGLDELGLSEAGVSIGKRISNELYLTYQQGLAGAASTLFIFYDITRKLTLRASASEASAVDLVYTIKYD